MDLRIYSSKARAAAAVIAAIAAATLLLRIILRFEDSGSVIGAISYLSQYFTILTNTLVMLLMLGLYLGRAIGPRLILSLTIAIVCVGVIYHVALAHLLDLSGLHLLADHGVHTVVPLLTLLWWLVFAQKKPATWPDPVIWVIWPVLYCVYILIRAHFSGFYPYPFLNLPELGWGGLAMSIAVIIVVFVILGFVLSLIGKVISGGKARS